MIMNKNLKPFLFILVAALVIGTTAIFDKCFNNVFQIRIIKINKNMSVRITPIFGLGSFNKLSIPDVYFPLVKDGGGTSIQLNCIKI